MEGEGVALRVARIDFVEPAPGGVAPGELYDLRADEPEAEAQRAALHVDHPDVGQQLGNVDGVEVAAARQPAAGRMNGLPIRQQRLDLRRGILGQDYGGQGRGRSEEQTYELQSLMRISYAVLCLKKQKTT